jgi:multidrug resistance efflux pump
MGESKVAEQPTSVGGRLKRLIVPVLIFAMAVAIVVVIAGNWNAWASEKAAQETDDAYTRADLTPLSTKVAGLVGTVAVPITKASRPEIFSCNFAMTTFARSSSRRKPE